MDYETIRYSVEDQVALLTYDRPDQRNAINRRMNSELQHAWQRFRDDDDAFVLVMTGAGEAFCAGWDLADAAEWPREDWDTYRRNLHNLAGICGYTRKVDVFKPVCGELLILGKSVIRHTQVRGSPFRASGSAPLVGFAMQSRQSPAHRNHERIRADQVLRNHSPAL